MTCITLRGLGGDVDDGDAVAVGVVFAHPQFVWATTQPFDAGGGRDPACSLCPFGWRAAQDVPVTLHIRICRICRVVRAFDPSGVDVNSAESDSAVRCRHGEFDSSHGLASSLLVRRGIVDRGERVSSAPRSCHDPSCDTVADYANPRASRRRSRPPDAIREPNRPRTRDRYRRAKGSPDLSHPMHHCHIAAGRCITFDTIRLGVSAARREGHPGTYRK